MPHYKSGPHKGEYLSWSSWFKVASEGIKNITPLQQAKSEKIGVLLNLIGIICGIVVMAWQWKTFWWIEIILIGSLLMTVLSYLSTKKKIETFKAMEDLTNVEEESEQ
jgi:C4-dicarboxylate transporter